MSMEGLLDSRGFKTSPVVLFGIAARKAEFVGAPEPGAACRPQSIR